jgi:hypothetical protein
VRLTLGDQTVCLVPRDLSVQVNVRFPDRLHASRRRARAGSCRSNDLSWRPFRRDGRREQAAYPAKTGPKINSGQPQV